jgi:hypothetical protein
MASSGMYSLEVRPRGQSFTLPSKLASADQASFVLSRWLDLRGEYRSWCRGYKICLCPDLPDATIDL